MKKTYFKPAYPGTAARLVFMVGVVFICMQCNTRPEKIDEKSIGVKIYTPQDDYTPIINQWTQLGINTALVSVDILADQKYRRAVRQHQIQTFVILPVFFDEEALLADSSLYAVLEDGSRAADSWVKFACPSDSVFRSRKVSQIATLIKNYQPEGISIDFIRHFVYWEMVPPNALADSLPNACFDARCIAGFERYFNIKMPDSLVQVRDQSSWILGHFSDAWTQWKCHLITSMVREIVGRARQIKPDLKINLHIVPWRKDDFDGAIMRIAGQQLDSLSQYADLISPMTYAHMVHRDASWVHSVVGDMQSSAHGMVVPSIQVKEEYLSDSLSSEEFEQNLVSALQPPSAGVIFWSWEHLQRDPWKKDIILHYLQSIH